MKKRFFSDYLINHHTPWFTDADNDEVPDISDCEPFNPDKQGPMHERLKQVKQDIQKKLQRHKEQREEYQYEKSRELDKLKGFDLFLFVKSRTGKWIRIKKIDRMQYELHPAKIDAMIKNIMRNPRWRAYHLTDDQYWADRKNIRDERIEEMTTNLKESFKTEPHELSESSYSTNERDIFKLERDLVWNSKNKQNKFGFPNYRPLKRGQCFTGKVLMAPFQRGDRAEPYFPPFFDYQSRYRRNVTESDDVEVSDEQGF